MNRLLREMTYDKELIDNVLYDYYVRNYKIKDLEIHYQVSARTIYNWRKRYKKEDYVNKNLKEIRKQKIFKRDRKKHKCKLTSEIENYIINYISKKQLTNGKRIRKSIQQKFKIKLALSTIYRWFSKLSITYKKVHKRKTYVCKEKEMKLKQLFNKINNIKKINNLISIDESHFQLEMTKRNGWEVKGKKIYKNLYNKKTQSVSLLMAINNNKVIGYVIYKGSINAVKFTEFIKSIHKDKYYYLLDNARIHHSKIFKKYMSNKMSNVIYNVAYNPETNPIEHVFSTLKHYITDYNTNNLSNLRKSISKTINKVKSDHLKNYYRKSLNV